MSPAQSGAACAVVAPSASSVASKSASNPAAFSPLRYAASASASEASSGEAPKSLAMNLAASSALPTFSAIFSLTASPPAAISSYAICAKLRLSKYIHAAVEQPSARITINAMAATMRRAMLLLLNPPPPLRAAAPISSSLSACGLPPCACGLSCARPPTLCLREPPAAQPFPSPPDRLSRR